jgi:hypothetical protein
MASVDPKKRQSLPTTWNSEVYIDSERQRDEVAGLEDPRGGAGPAGSPSCIH